MNDLTEGTSGLSPNKQALLKIRELKQQLADAQQGDAGDIAIVSMACRFPRQSRTPEEFWECLLQGRDQITEIPEDRWDLEAFFDEDPEVPGKMYARRGVFLENIDLMDPEFFGISPREATWVDPQQRLLLEVGWEALERAGWPADRVGQNTGVFVGWMHNDYQNEASDSFLNLNPYIATGAAGSFLCGRLAYYLGLQGPSVAVDTACSSSLVALHLACQSLHRRDCDRALVGGVNAIVSPTTNILTCKLNALSPSGQSRAFDAQADGYVRGEGCGVVTLRRLADAQRAGDPILGIIRGSSVGHNGSGGGLTVPNSRAQERVIRQALQRGGIDPSEVAYLEAHGTGTELGDPIEIQAAAAALTQTRTSQNRLLVGSVKTNVGHLEAAAGMAGLIKVLLAFENQLVPAQINFEEPNPHIPWDRLPLDIVVQPTDWPARERRIAGVSAFGMSGTNAHVVLEAPPQVGDGFVPRASSLVSRDDPPGDKVGQPKSTTEARASQLFVLSAQTEDALRDLAARHRQWLSSHEQMDLQSVAHTLGVGRKHFECRAALVAETYSDVLAGLDQLQNSSQAAHLHQRRVRGRRKIAWQFTGQGAQYAGMARGLFASQPVFREALIDCDELLRGWRNDSLLDVIFGNDERLNHTSWTQPALFAMQRGLAQLLTSWGLKPDVVFGHSVGQYAAACVAGVLSWTDGLRLISERGRLIGDLPAGGAMAAVFAPAHDVEQQLNDQKQVALAAVNGSHVVISGPAGDVEESVAQFAKRGIRCKPLTTSHAFHSSLMDPALEPFQTVADKLTYKPPQIPLICNVSGEFLPHDKCLNGEYWRRHIREAVQFAASVKSAQEFGCEVLLELGPQAVLTNMAASIWTGEKAGLISCLQKDSPDERTLVSAVGQLYVAGLTPDFSKLEPTRAGHRIVLPTYPFQRRRFWGPAKPRAAHANFHTEHPLLGGKCSLAGLPNETRYESFIEPDSPPWLPDHEVMGDIVFPGAAFVELALAAARDADLRQLTFEQPLRPRGRTAVQTVVRPSDGGHRILEIYSSPAGSSNWSRHVKAELHPENTKTPAKVDREEIRARCLQTAQPSAFYRNMQQLGLNYGPQFQTVQALDYSDREVLAHLKSAGDLRGYRLAPPLLDGALHALAVGLLHDSDSSLFLPVSMQSVECYGVMQEEVWCHAKLTEVEGDERSADVTVMDGQGNVVARINELRLRRLDRAALRRLSGSGAQRLMYELHWKPYRLPPGRTDKHHWLVVGSGDALQQLTSQMLCDHGHQVANIHLGQVDQSNNDPGTFTLNADDAQAWTRLLDRLEDWQAGFRPEGVVWLLAEGEWTCDDMAASSQCMAAHTQQHCTGLVGLVSAFRQKEVVRLECGLQMVTRRGVRFSGQPGSAAESPTETSEIASPSPEQAQYWGLGRVIGAEHPEFRCRLIDLDPSDHVGPASQLGDGYLQLLRDVILNDAPENQVAIHGEQIWIPRLQASRIEADATPSGETEPIIRSGASYLITGGLGMLGRQAALWLARQGAEHVVLVSRRAPSASMLEIIQEIEELGCHVTVQQTDFAVSADVEGLLRRFGQDLPDLRGVIHAAGVLDDGLVTDQTWERFEKVLAPKANGAWLLHELTQDMPLDFFVLYSSAASVLGSPGQSNYATANAFLDGLAWQRHFAGLPALSVNWGPWTEGMADDEHILKRLALQGITPLSVAEAHDALEKMLRAGQVQTLVMDVDWRRMRMGMGGEVPSLLADVTPAGRSSRQSDSELVVKLRALAGAERRSLMVTSIQAELQDILSTSQPPETDRPLIEMGLDSLMAVEFGTRLQQQLGDELAIAPTMLFDHPTIDAISDHVLELLSGSDSEPVAAVVSDSQQEVITQPGNEDVAVIGMSCRFPGARGLEEFWMNLMDGVDSVREIPEDRWDVDRFYDPDGSPGKMISREGGFLEDIGDFDADFFNISEQEACWIDPQHRLLLETSWTALEEAGIAASPLADKNVGVFMGIMSSDYAFLPSLEDEGLVQAFQGAGFAHSAGVGRISHVFGFEGPSLAIDSASSSSLVAVCQAMRSLQDGNCNMALAGGVNAILAPVNSLLMTKAGLLAPDGRSKSFSADANGFGRGEGCGVIVMKRLSDAERDGDRILAVIRGGAISHNGFSGAITSPSSRAQAKVIAEACQNAGVAPTEVQYLEAHGTGTEYGDPMEIGAAMSVLGKGRKKDKPLLVGSVKANISHLEAAGGISGLIKTILAMHHGVIPRQIHFEHPSPHIPWARLPLKVVTEPTPWPDSQRRIAGVTALGLSGTNAHVIVGSHLEPDTDPASDVQSERAHHLLVLSARDEQALADLAWRYQEYLSSGPAAELADICYTAAVGRKHLEHRAALLVTSKEHAAQSLEKLSGKAGLTSARPAHEITVKPNGSPLEANPHMGVAHGASKIGWYFGDGLAEAESAVCYLYRDHPVFRDSMLHYDSILQEIAHDSRGHVDSSFTPGGGLRAWLEGRLASLKASQANASQVAESEQLTDVQVFATQAALSSLWLSWGIEPDAVLGVGVGQYAAVCAAGGLAVEDAWRLVIERERVRSVLGSTGNPHKAESELNSEDRKALDQFEAIADTLNYYPPNRPLICSLSGEVVPVHRSLAGSYWRRHCHEAPLLEKSIQAFVQLKCDTVLAMGATASTDRLGIPAGVSDEMAWISSLRPSQAPVETLLSALGQLYAGGCTPDFKGFDAPWFRQKVSLPTYPFRRKRYWITELAEHVGK